MTRLGALALVALLSACQGDETVAAYGAAGKTWHLTELDGVPFTARATVRFPEFGKIAGDGPCNRYSTSMTVPYPWFEAGTIQSTDMACPDLDAEHAFFAALASMSQSEVWGDTMILRTEDGQEMVFKASG